jgi:hypothetical protein
MDTKPNNPYQQKQNSAETKQKHNRKYRTENIPEGVKRHAGTWQTETDRNKNSQQKQKQKQKSPSRNRNRR